MTGRTVVHAIRSDAFAGVERYVCEVVTALVQTGWKAVVVGGDPGQMRRHLPPQVCHMPAVTTAAVARALLSAGADVVHSHMTAADVASCLTHPLTRAALVSTRHFPGRRGARPSTQRLLQPLLSVIDFRIAISGYVAASAVDPRERVLLHGIGQRPLVPVDVRRQEVLVLQRLEPEKDGATALRAWADSSLRERGWVLRVAGEGSERQRLKELAKDLGVAGSVEFLGFVDDPAPLLARAGALLAPTRVEAFGLAVVEGMATGTPVVAARGGAHLETLGPDAWLFTPGEPRACARLLDRLADDPLAAAEYGINLHRAQRERLSLGAHVDRLQKLYRQALAARGAP